MATPSGGPSPAIKIGAEGDRVDQNGTPGSVICAAADPKLREKSGPHRQKYQFPARKVTKLGRTKPDGS